MHVDAFDVLLSEMLGWFIPVTARWVASMYSRATGDGNLVEKLVLFDNID
jgi:hypothetical protein